MWLDKDKAWLATHYPGLTARDSQTIEGRLSFQMLHANGVHYVRPTSDLITTHEDGTYLCDTYNIKILQTADSPIPAVYEVGGRITDVAMRKGKMPIDLHLYSSTGATCLASSMELERTFSNGFNLPTFIDEFVVPYFFAQSYYELHEEWPWGELKHGYLGLLQWLGRADDYDDEDVESTYRTITAQSDSEAAKSLLEQRCRGHRPCPCKSGRKTRDCCPDIKIGIARLRDGIRRDVISLKS